MEEKDAIKMSLSTFLLILAVIIIAIMGVFIYKLNNEKNVEVQRTNELQEQVNNLNETVDNLQEKLDAISTTINSSIPVQSSNSNETTSTTNTSKLDNTKYEITTRNDEYGDEIYAIIKATKDGKTVTKEFEMGALIAETGTMKLPIVGTVALVADTGGEYYGVNIYQLVDDEIECLGLINCAVDMVIEASYEVTTKDETTVVITAKRNSENIQEEFKMDGTIEKTEVIDILECGKVVLVAENDGENYIIKAYRLSKDYINGETQGIIEAGTIQCLF